MAKMGPRAAKDQISGVFQPQMKHGFDTDKNVLCAAHAGWPRLPDFGLPGCRRHKRLQTQEAKVEWFNSADGLIVWGASTYRCPDPLDMYFITFCVYRRRKHLGHDQAKRIPLG